MKKKILLSVLSLVFSLSAFGQNSNFFSNGIANYGITNPSLQYVRISSIPCTTAHFLIPSTVVRPSNQILYTVTTLGVLKSAVNCTTLKSVTIPNSINLIIDNAFTDLSLSSVTVNWTTPLNINALSNFDASQTILYVPKGTVALYQQHPVWSSFGTILEQPGTFKIDTGTQIVTSGSVSINFAGGNVANNGIINNPNGTLRFNEPLFFEGTGTTNTRNLTIAHAGTSTLNNRINVSGTLVINNGNLDANNNLTLLSNASGSAVIAPVPATSAITGKVTVQRHIPQGKRAFRFLTPGVTTDDFICNNWQLQTHITGSTTGANGFDQTASGSSSMFVYNNQQETGSGWAAIANTNATNLTSGRGYRLLVRGDRTPTNITAASQPNMNTAITLEATGTVTTGTVTFNTTSAIPINNTSNSITDGFSLLGNPYVNTVNWNDLSKTGLSDAYYAWDANMGTAAQRGRYVVYSTALGSNNAASAVNQYIQPGQAFFVKNSTQGTPGTLTFQETNKVGGNTVSNEVFSEPTPLTRMQLQVYDTNELALNNYPIDAAVAIFDTSFENSSVVSGIEKLSTGTENLSFHKNNKNWAIQTNGLPQLTDEIAIELNQFVANKNYSFKTTIPHFDSDLTPYLFDAYTNQFTELLVNNTTIYAFQTNAEAASFANNRFKIVFQNQTLSNPDLNENALAIYPNPVTNGQFTIALPAKITGEVNVNITNLLGQTVYETKRTAAPTLAIQVDKNLPQAVYVVTISNNGKNITKKITIK